MSQLFRLFLIGMSFFVCSPAMGQEPSLTKSPEEMLEARRTGWQLATLIADKLKEDDLEEYPGIEAWLMDLEKATKGVDLKVTPDEWPAVDIDALITHNPNFWQAHYEIAPGDPGLNLLHAGLLLSVGESTRASNFIVVARQRPDIPKPLIQGLQALLINAQSYSKKSNIVVDPGTKLHDAGDYAGALKEYEAALSIWPQNGLAYYEIGYTRREQDMVNAGEKKLDPNAVVVNGSVRHSPEVEAAFAKSRQHEPFQFKAYQGSDQEVLRGLKALATKGMPAWQKLASNIDKRQEDKVLEDLANACQTANIHDLALVTRQILVARRKSYAPSDHPFITASLRKLAPCEQTETVLKRIGTGVLKLRQLVPSEAE